MATDPRAIAIAAELPVSDDEHGHIVPCPYSDSDEVSTGEIGCTCPEVIPLADIVITAIEHHEFTHFRVRKYDPDADGLTAATAWAIVEPLASGLKTLQAMHSPTLLWESTVRAGVRLYLNDRLSKGMDEEEARKMVDGVYTDVLVCDSIIQFILYGEEVFG